MGVLGIEPQTSGRTACALLTAQPSLQPSDKAIEAETFTESTRNMDDGRTE